MIALKMIPYNRIFGGKKVWQKGFCKELAKNFCKFRLIMNKVNIIDFKNAVAIHTCPCANFKFLFVQACMQTLKFYSYTLTLKFYSYSPV